ncbi:head-tail connector protein [Enterococcus sp. LJL99]
MELTELKNYLRVDTSLDDSLLDVLKESAENYITNAIENAEEVKQDKRFELAVALLVGSWYAQRENTVQGSIQEIPLGVQSLITQLRGV